MSGEGAGADAQVGAAIERLESSRSQASGRHYGNLRSAEQYVVVTNSDELMKECKEGLIPQSKAVYNQVSRYQSDREKFSAVIQAFLEEMPRGRLPAGLIDHETALAHLETLTERIAMKEPCAYFLYGYNLYALVGAVCIHPYERREGNVERDFAVAMGTRQLPRHPGPQALAPAMTRSCGGAAFAGEDAEHRGKDRNRGV